MRLVSVQKSESMRKFFIPLVLLGLSLNLFAQDAKDIKRDAIPVAMFQVTYAAQLPALDTRVNYGFTNTIGGSFVFKTESNWLLTANGNYIFGPKVKGDPEGRMPDRVYIFGEGITTNDGEITGGSGSFTTFALYQRGFHFQGEIGKLFPFKPNPNSGFFVQLGAGYLRNRIRIDYQTEMYNTPYQVIDDYQYGYDRMRGGFACHGEAGYLVLSDSRVLNFSLSLEVTYARTRDLRDYDFRVFTNPETGIMEPVGRTDPHKRYNDFYYGIRLCWNIPTYQRQPETYYYD